MAVKVCAYALLLVVRHLYLKHLLIVLAQIQPVLLLLLIPFLYLLLLRKESIS